MSNTAKSQFIERVGLELGGTYSNTSDADYFQYYTRAFVRRQIMPQVNAEAGLGFGLINGREYKTRLIPLDLRFHYYPIGTQHITTSNHLIIASPYLFGGLGSLGFRPISVQADDNPLTQEVGPSLVTTSMWGFSQNWAMVVPVGIGTDFRLDDRAAVSAKISYQQTTSNGLVGGSSSGMQGYWTFTLGMHFNTERRRAPAPPIVTSARANPILRTLDIYERDADLSLQLAIDKINSARFNYDRYETVMSEEERQILAFISVSMLEFPELNVEVYGHTDYRGGVYLNQAISRTRAWNVLRYMANDGIDPIRLKPHGMGRDYPIADNDTEEGRYLNRRVEFSAYTSDPFDEMAMRERWMELEVPGFQIDEEVINYDHIRFTVFRQTEPSLLDEQRVMEIAAFMHQNPDVNLRLETWSNLHKYQETQEALGIARAQVITNELFLSGLSQDRFEIITHTVPTWQRNVEGIDRQKHDRRMIIATFIKAKQADEE